MNNLFEEIEKEKKDLPEMKLVTKHFADKKTFNIYQLVALIVFVIGFFGGILLGNMIPACADVNLFNQCTTTEFNISLTLLTWGGVFLFSLFFYSIGHRIQLLQAIYNKLK